MKGKTRFLILLALLVALPFSSLRAQIEIGERETVGGCIEMSIPQGWLLKTETRPGFRSWLWTTDSTKSETHAPGTGPDAIFGVSIRQIKPDAYEDDRRTIGQIEIANRAMEAREKNLTIQGRACGEDKVGGFKCEKVCFNVANRTYELFVAQKEDLVYCIWYECRSSLNETFQEPLLTIARSLRFKSPTFELDLATRRLAGGAMEIQLPTGWKVDSLTDGNATRWSFGAPSPTDTAMAMRTVTIVRIDPFVTVMDTSISDPTDRARYWIDVVISEGGGGQFELLKTDEREVNGFKGLLFEWAIANEISGRIYHQYHLAVVRGQQLYAVITECGERDFAAHRKSFERIINSVKLQ